MKACIGLLRIFCNFISFFFFFFPDKNSYFGQVFIFLTTFQSRSFCQWLHVDYFIVWWFSLFHSQVCWLQRWPLVFTARPSLPYCTWCPSPCCLCSPWPTWRYVSLCQNQKFQRDEICLISRNIKTVSTSFRRIVICSLAQKQCRSLYRIIFQLFEQGVCHIHNTALHYLCASTYTYVRLCGYFTFLLWRLKFYAGFFSLWQMFCSACAT